MESCKGLCGQIFGHKFQPVFNSERDVQPALNFLRSANRIEIDDVPSAMNSLTSTKETYIKSICSRCGQEKV